MSPISKPQLLLYLQLSQIESVYQVAQNPDIMTLILNELEPMWNYNSVVKEFQDPRFHRHTKRLQNGINKQVHCGRIYLRVIYPKPNHYWYWIQRFKCENINLYGMIINTGKRWQGVDLSPAHDSMRSFNHADLDNLLLAFGYNKFKSKTKGEKIHMLIKHSDKIEA
eukprot:COSAG06_NODE_4083_length_4593_cov_1.575211_7_plen_167_part_00